jgi:hypothetical protein
LSGIWFPNTWALHLAEMLQRILIVAIEGDPLAAVRMRIHCVDSQGDVTFQMLAIIDSVKVALLPSFPFFGRK